MAILRTPIQRFQDLPDYPFRAHYLCIGKDLSMHYVDEGPQEGPCVLLLHGEPSWSFLYRKMIPPLVEAGYRVIAPDLIGFGKSDKLSDPAEYTYQSHQEWLQYFITNMELENIVLFCQDWGGLLGLRLAIDLEDRFSAIIAANTILPTGALPMPPAFQKWRDFVAHSPDFHIGQVIDKATVNDLSPEIMAAYDAPFPDESFKVGARLFPALVPVTPDDPEAIKNIQYLEKLAQWEKPFLTLFSDSDPIMKGGERFFQKIVPGAKGQNHEIIPAGGHFLQEDQGELIAEKIIEFIKNI